MPDPGTEDSSDEDEEVRITTKLDRESAERLRARYPVARNDSEAVRMAINQVLHQDSVEQELVDLVLNANG